MGVLAFGYGGVTASTVCKSRKGTDRTWVQLPPLPLRGESMKRFIACWLLSWADLIDTIMEILTFGLVLRTEAAHVVLANAEIALIDAEWIDWRDAWLAGV